MQFSESELEGAKVSALQLAQKLIITTPEYNVAAADIRSSATAGDGITTGREEGDTAEGGVVDTDTAGEELPPRPYKAVVVVNLGGGVDSWQMLLPNHDGCSDLYDEYKVRLCEIYHDSVGPS